LRQDKPASAASTDCAMNVARTDRDHQSLVTITVAGPIIPAITPRPARRRSPWACSRRSLCRAANRIGIVARPHKTRTRRCRPRTTGMSPDTATHETSLPSTDHRAGLQGKTAPNFAPIPCGAYRPDAAHHDDPASREPGSEASIVPMMPAVAAITVLLPPASACADRQHQRIALGKAVVATTARYRRHRH